MKIRVRCDCGKTLVAPSELAGKKTRCPACGAVIRLPQLEEVSEPPYEFFRNDTGVDLTSAEAGRILEHDRLATNGAGENQEATCTPPPETTKVLPPVPVTTPQMSRLASFTPQENDETNTSTLIWFRLGKLTATAAQKGRTWWQGLNAWDAFQIKKTRRVIVGVAAVLIAVAVVLPFLRGGRRELKTEEIVARSEAAVAFIQGEGGSGSGFLIAKGLVITNAHVLDDEFMENVKVHFPHATANDKGPFKAQLVYEDSWRDLAVVSINSNATPLKLAQAFVFRRGQDVTVIGSPGVGDHVLKNAVSRGVMSTETELDLQTVYQLGIAINPGNSGGPVFDSYGDMVGVVTARATKQEGLAFAVRLTDVRNVLAIATLPGARVAETATARHRAVVLSRRIASAARISLTAMHRYNDAMDDARKRGLRAQDGLDIAQAVWREKLITANVWVVDVDASTLVPKVGADQNLSKDVRRWIVDLWTNYCEIMTCAFDPKGKATSFRVKTMQLQGEHKRAIEALKESLGLADL